MQIVTNPRVFPRKSITGRQGALLDTGWLWDHPGPGQIYFHEREIAEALRHALHMDGVIDVLKAAGWQTADEVAETAAVADQAKTVLEQELAMVKERLAAFETLFPNVAVPQTTFTGANDAHTAVTAPAPEVPATMPVTTATAHDLKPKPKPKAAAKKKGK